MSIDTSETSRETPERRGWLGTLMAFLSPGLGYMYVGRIGRGLLYNLLFVAMFAAGIAVVTVCRVFPLPALAVLVVAWLVFSGLAAHSVREIIDDESESFEAESYNHWTVYSAITLLTYALPLAATLLVTHQFLWTFQRVESTAMYPNILPGEIVIVDRRGYESRPVERGELLTFDGESSGWSIRRLAGSGHDDIRVEGYTLYVNDRERPKTPLPSGALRIEPPRLPTDPFQLMVEQNSEHRYVISVVPSARFETGFHTRSLEGDQMYVLADNRNKKTGPFSSKLTVRDSRDFGPISPDTVRGKPLYVAWSSGERGVRWNRIGVRLQ